MTSSLVVDQLAGTPYRTNTILACSATTEVLEAQHTVTGKIVAVKLLKSASPSTDEIERFRLEYQIPARIENPHVVSVLDAGTTAQGLPFFAMERLWGETLDCKLADVGKLDPQEATTVVTELLDALAAVHRLGVVHRDVRLENILHHEPQARDQPVVKLLGFGSAKVQVGVAPYSPPPLEVPTEEWRRFGSPRMIAPESILGNEIGPSADLYSVGVVYYTLLTGADPFAEHETLRSVLSAVLREQPRAPSKRIDGAVPAAVDEVVLRALAKEPSERYQSAEEFLQAVRALSTESLIQPEPVGVWTAPEGEREQVEVEQSRRSSVRPLQKPPRSSGRTATWALIAVTALVVFAIVAVATPAAVWGLKETEVAK